MAEQTGLTVTPEVGVSVLWYNYGADGELAEKAPIPHGTSPTESRTHGGCPVYGADSVMSCHEEPAPTQTSDWSPHTRVLCLMSSHTRPTGCVG